MKLSSLERSGRKEEGVRRGVTIRPPPMTASTRPLLRSCMHVACTAFALGEGACVRLPSPGLRKQKGPDASDSSHSPLPLRDAKPGVAQRAINTPARPVRRGQEGHAAL